MEMCQLKDKSGSNQPEKKLVFLATLKTLALKFRTNAIINKDVMKESANITVQVHARNIFLVPLISQSQSLLSRSSPRSAGHSPVRKLETIATIIHGRWRAW